MLTLTPILPVLSTINLLLLYPFFNLIKGESVYPISPDSLGPWYCLLITAFEFLPDSLIKLFMVYVRGIFKESMILTVFPTFIKESSSTLLIIISLKFFTVNIVGFLPLKLQ